MVKVGDVLDGHVVLDLECLDRIYLNGYVPTLQVGGQVVNFLTRHRGNPIPSPALLATIGDRFRDRVDRFARDNRIPLVRFEKGERKAEMMKPYLDAAALSGRSQVVAIGTAQEFQLVFSPTTRKGDAGRATSQRRFVPVRSSREEFDDGAGVQRGGAPGGGDAEGSGQS